MVAADSVLTSLLITHLVATFLIGFLIWKDIGWFKVYPTPKCTNEWALVQTSAAAAMTFWLGIVATLVALLSVDIINTSPFHKSAVIALLINASISGILALMPLASNIFVEIKSTKRTPIYKPLGLAWMLLVLCVLEAAIVILWDLAAH